jgi:AcrR family transcriptional regulator
MFQMSTETEQNMIFCSAMDIQAILKPVHSAQTESKMKSQAKQNRRTTNTRNTILDAAVSLYQSQGIDSTSISAVIEKSEVGRTTFYRHFSDRDDVLNQALIRDFETLMADFKSATRQYATLEEQIEEDMIWFLDQFAHRSALSLLFSNVQWQRYQQAAQTLTSFRQASIACASPTFQRAAEEGRLREGITLEKYIDWASFVVVSMQVVKLPASENRLRSREMLRNFLVPSLIMVD